MDNGTQSKPETVEASEPEKENKKGAGSDEAMDNLETPPVRCVWRRAQYDNRKNCS